MADFTRQGLPLSDFPHDIRVALRGKTWTGIFQWSTMTSEPPVGWLTAVAAGKSEEPVVHLWRAFAVLSDWLLKPVKKVSHVV